MPLTDVTALSLSAEVNEIDLDLQMINGEDDASTAGISYAAELIAFAEAVAQRGDSALSIARSHLAATGGAGLLVDAAAVAGNFQRMVRIADATGIPADPGTFEAKVDLIEQLGLEQYESAIRDARVDAEANRQAELTAAREEQSTMTAQARSDAEAELARARTEMTQSLNEARATLRESAEDLATAAAEQVLGRTLS